MKKKWYTKLGDWINEISLLYENLVKKGMLHMKNDGKEANKKKI